MGALPPEVIDLKATEQNKVLIDKLCDSINLRLISHYEFLKEGKKLDVPLCRMATDDGYYDARVPGKVLIGEEVISSLIELFQEKGWSVSKSIEFQVLVFKYKK